MHFREYLDTVLSRENRNFDTICPRFNDKFTRLFHGVVGINTEVGELVESLVHPNGNDNLSIECEDEYNLREELGDLQFYVAMCFDIFEIDYASIVNPLETFYGVSHIISELQKEAYCLLDMCKKVMIYGREIDNAFFSSKLILIQAWLEELACEYGFQIEDIWVKNDEKLGGRYKEGFTEREALNRNLTVERQILESN